MAGLAAAGALDWPSSIACGLSGRASTRCCPWPRWGVRSSAPGCYRATDWLWLSRGRASLVDVTLEFLTQLVFLLLGVTALALTTPDDAWEKWTGAALLTTCGAVGLLAAQRFGLLRLFEALARQIAARWPSAGGLDGMEAATVALYRRRGPLLTAAALHLAAWILGSVESWAVLQLVTPGGHPGAGLDRRSLGHGGTQRRVCGAGGLGRAGNGVCLCSRGGWAARDVRPIAFPDQTGAGDLCRSAGAAVLAAGNPVQNRLRRDT